jgi:hypothetical protein
LRTCATLPSKPRLALPSVVCIACPKDQQSVDVYVGYRAVSPVAVVPHSGITSRLPPVRGLTTGRLMAFRSQVLVLADHTANMVICSVTSLIGQHSQHIHAAYVG